MNYADVYSSAREALRDNRMEEVLKLSEVLIRSDYAPANASGYLMRGLAYEVGNESIERDLERAIVSYRKAASLAPDAITFLYLARVMMKQGGEQHSKALRYIDEARSIRKVPEVDLAYAKYYECGRDQNYAKARHYYARAALAGRFSGFFGYSTISRKMGQNVRAALVDAFRLIISPFLLLVLGRGASKTL